MDDETIEDIMRAVYSALCTHGYADLTMQDIADESVLSKAALHYHYDTKRDLLLAFLEHLHGKFTERLADAEAAAGDDPADRLVTFIDAALFPPERADADLREFRTAVLEIKAQAPYVPAFREHLAKFDGFVHDRVAAIVAEGVERGRFDERADPETVACFVVTVINGAHTRSVAVDHAVEDTRAVLVEYLCRHLAIDEEVVAR
jgi:AcrR family transcriptional regulator